MSVLTAVQIRQYAYAAGFRFNDLNVAVAVALAESGGDTQAYNPEWAAGTPPGHGSRGLWQIYGWKHREYDSDATFDPQTNANAAYAIYRAAGGFKPWSTYNSGAYLQYMGNSQTQGGTGPGGLVTTKSAAEVWPWLNLANRTQHWGWNYYGNTRVWEDGIDISMPHNTQITSLTNGTVLDTGYYGGGGVVSVRSDGVLFPDGSRNVASVYYQHLDNIFVQPGAVVQVGDVIGVSGGQLQGGLHPATCCSTGSHLEVGINCKAGAQSLWRPLGPEVDPEPWLRYLVAHGAPITSGGPVGNFDLALTDATTGLTHPSGPVGDSALAICQRIDFNMKFFPPDRPLGWYFHGTPQDSITAIPRYIGDNAWFFRHNIAAGIYRASYIVLGLLIISLVLSNLIRGAVEDVAAPLASAAVRAG